MLGGSPLGGSPLGGLGLVDSSESSRFNGRQFPTIAEATLSLYPAGADCEALLDQAVWWGACARQLDHAESFTEKLFAATGEAYRTAYHLDENHELTIGRTWAVPTSTLADLKLSKNERFVLVVVWLDPRTQNWQRNIFYGVTFRSRRRSSGSTLYFMEDQVLRAQYYTADAGATAYTPTPPSGTAFALPFYHEDPLATGDYLVGHYKWGGQIQLTGARLIARAPQTTAHVLTLEIDGALTSTTMTIPVGAVDEEMVVDLSLDLTVEAAAVIRWKITDGPASSGDRGYDLSLTMQGESI